MGGQAKALAAMETPAKAAEPSATAVGHKSGSKKARKPRAAPSTATNTHKGQQDVQKAVPGPILPGETSRESIIASSFVLLAENVGIGSQPVPKSST